jgi:hypothetical protein
MGMQQSVARSEPVVLRSSWLMTFANVAVPLAAVLLVFLVMDAWSGSWLFLVMFLALTFSSERRRRVVLTDEGIAIRNLRTVVVPWSHIERVELTGSRWTGTSIRVYDVVANMSYRLQAPTACWGMGYPALHRAHDLVRDRWLAHRDGPRPPLDQWAWRPGPPPAGPATG